MANKLKDMLQDVHQRAKRPLTREMNERRQTLSERQLYHQSLESLDSDERFHT
ncbi:hypothetical protein DPMN_102503, partial [Dreissena polymorpha]